MLKEMSRKREGDIGPNPLVPILKSIFPMAPSKDAAMIIPQTTNLSNEHTSPIVYGASKIKLAVTKPHDLAGKLKFDLQFLCD